MAVVPRPPRGLRAEIVECDGEEMVVFSWDADSSSEDAEPLTEAERDVLARVVAGASNGAIAAARRVSVRTIANQVASLLKKLGARSRYDLVRAGAGADRKRGDRGAAKR